MFLTAFVFANLITILFLLKKGHNLKTLFEMIVDGLLECKSIFLVIFLMGATISVWLSSGIVPSLIFYGFNYLRNVNLVLASFLGTVIISYVMGTAVGTLSTVGIALLAIGAGLNIPPPVLLGAIISGSFISDKIAPISSLTNLTIQMTEVSYGEYLKTSLLTLVPTIFISSFIYYIIGIRYSGSIDSNIISQYQDFIRQSFVISPYFFIFPIIIIILAFVGLNIVYNMSISVLAASLITIFIQRQGVMNTVKAILWGYKANTGIESLDTLISGGGALTMVNVVLIVTGSVALSSLFQGGGLLKPLVNIIYKKNDGKFKLIGKTGLLSMLLMTMTCDQTVGILIPTKLAGERFEKAGLKRAVLARTISDTSTIFSPLLPWNVNALIIYGVVGISALSYGPYAVLCYINPIITFIAGAINFKKTANSENPPYYPIS